MKINGCLVEEFDTRPGTKQGDPLSPSLFGLFIEQLHYLLQLETPDVGQILHGSQICFMQMIPPYYLKVQVRNYKDY